MKTKKSDLISTYAQSIGTETAKELITKKINAAALEDKEDYTGEEITRICGELTKEGGLIRIVAQTFLIQLERKKSEEQTLLLDNIETQIWYLTNIETYGAVNKACAEFWGMEKEDLEGKSLYDIVGREEAEVCIAGNREVFEKKKRIHTEGWVKNGKRETRLLSITRTPKLGDNGNVEYVICAAEDITERKRAEEALKGYSERLEEMVEERTQELREAQERLVRREKLAVLGQLAGGVGHELRNPLGVIKNCAYFLNMVLEEPDPEVKETLEILDQEVGTCEKIISSLLDFARPKPPMHRKVDVNEVVQDALTRTAVPENVEVVSQLDGALPTIPADPDQLRQVFGNIILNAIQAMPDGGRLVVKTSEVSGKPPRSREVAVSVTDTGVGISEENLERVFEPLFTTRAKGIGLGLALVKILVEGHGGSIEVENQEGQGSTFMVRLPMAG